MEQEITGEYQNEIFKRYPELECLGKEFLKTVNDFCREIAISAESLAQEIIKIGDAIDKALGNDHGFAAKAIVDRLNGELKEEAQKLISLYGLKGLKMAFTFSLPNAHHVSSLDESLTLVNYYQEEPAIDLKTHSPYDEVRSRLSCKPISGFKRQNHWKRIRSNPKLR